MLKLKQDFKTYLLNQIPSLHKMAIVHWNDYINFSKERVNYFEVSLPASGRDIKSSKIRLDLCWIMKNGEIRHLNNMDYMHKKNALRLIVQKSKILTEIHISEWEQMRNEDVKNLVHMWYWEKLLELALLADNTVMNELLEGGTETETKAQSKYEIFEEELLNFKYIENENAQEIKNPNKHYLESGHTIEFSPDGESSIRVSTLKGLTPE